MRKRKLVRPRRRMRRVSDPHRDQQIGGIESLEDRNLLAVDFVPAPLGSDQPNRTDQVIGLTEGFTQPTIALDPHDPGLLSVANESRVVQSSNAGTSFSLPSEFQIPPGSEVGVAGSSELVFDAAGKLHWAASVEDASGARSVGLTYQDGTIFRVGGELGEDGAMATRPVLAVDTNLQSDSPFAGYMYVSFTDEAANRVLLSRSIDNGLTWSAPVQVSDDIETTDGNLPPLGPASVTVGPNGDVYVAYHYQSGSTPPTGADNQSNSDGVSGQVIVRRSMDAGSTFVTKSQAFLPGEADISLNVQSISGAVPRARFWMQGARQPTILADPVRDGHLYVIANDDPDNVHGSGDEGNIVFARSTDYGDTWTRRTVDLRGSLQVMPQAEIDEFGNLAIAWYDSRRGNLQGGRDYRMDVYATYSTDGGSTFAKTFMVNDEFNPTDPVTPNTGLVYVGADRDADGRMEDDGDETYSLGNYFDLELHGGTGYVVWNGNERVIGLPSANQVFFDLFPVFGTLHVTGLDTDDTFVIRSMPDNEEFVEVWVNGQREYAGLRESLIGGIQVDGLAGNDTLIVDYETSGSDPVPPGGIFFQGNIPEGGNGVGDTLDILTGGRSIDFQAERFDEDAGLFLVGDSAAISFDSVERTQTGALDYLRPDAFEVNDTFATASVLGSEPAITLRDLTIHDVGNDQSNADFFRVTASQTGLMIVNALFDHEVGDLDLVLMDGNGNVVTAASDSAEGVNGEQIVFPVVAQESYVLLVFGVDGATNTYALEVENFEVPTPQSVTLDPADDSGMANNDGITGVTDPTFIVQADVGQLFEQHLPILNREQAESGQFSGGAVFVTVRDIAGGTLESGYADPIGDDLFSYDSEGLPDGSLLISSSVHVFDVRQVIEDDEILPDPAVGPSLESVPLGIIVDAESPTVTSPQMLPSSDSGMSRQDGVTNVMQPAFAGVSGPNELVRVFANGLLVGETMSGPDGRWEITVEPLTDGIYDMTTQVIDVAGNAGENGQINRIEIDTLVPNTPYLDLVDGSDTGLSNIDNVTGDNTPTLTMTSTDPGADHLSPFNYKFRIYDRPEGSEEVLVYDSVTDDSIPAENMRGGFTNLTFLTTTLAELVDGSHNLKLEVEDRAGNISEDFLLPIEVDTSLPTPISLDLISQSDSGMDDSDNVTRFNRPTFAGSGMVGGTVNLFADGQLVGTGVVGADSTFGVADDGIGAWQITSGTLDDGIHVLSATIESDAGLAESEPITVEIDTLVPSTPALDLQSSSDSGNRSDDQITNVSSPEFHFATQDPGQAAHLNANNYKYRLYVRLESGAEELVYDSVGDAAIPATATDGVFTSLENLTRTLSRELPDGVHNFKLEVEDRAGNISEDTLLDVQVDTTIEGDTNLEMLVASDSGMDNLDRVTNISQPAFEGLAEVGATVTLYANGNLVGSATVLRDEISPNDRQGEWTITTVPLADGIYDIHARVEDAAGNALSTESLQIEIDSRAPNTPFLDLDITSDDGISGIDNITSRDDLLLNMTTTDPGQADHIFLANYKYRLYLRTSDEVETLVYDSSTDDSLELQSGFTSLEALRTTLNDLEQGVYNFKLEVEDRAGNISPDTFLDVTIGREVDITTPTTIQLIPSSDAGMDPTDGVTRISTPVFSGLGEANGTVQLFANGDLVGTGRVGGDLTDGVDQDGAGLWEVASGQLDDGIYEIVAVVEDASGNLTRSESITIEIDTFAPNTPYLDLIPADDTGLSQQDNITFNRLPVFHMATLDPNQDEHLIPFNYKYRLYVRLDSGVERLVYDSTTDDSFPNSAVQDGFISLENLRRRIDLGVPDGVHDFKLEVEDRAGNISEDYLLGITIDGVLESPANGLSIDMSDASDSGMSNRDNVTRISRPSFVGIAETDAVVSIFANGQLVGTGRVGSDETDFVPGDGLGAWSVTVEPLDDGAYDVVAHVEDVAGNFLRTDAISIEIDTTQPNTPLLDLLSDTGQSDGDNVTRDAELSFNMTTEDVDLPGGRANPFNYKYRVFVRPDGGTEQLLYNSVVDPQIDPTEISEGFTNLEQLQRLLGPFPDGIHNFKLEVEDRAGNISEDFLLNVRIDSVLDAPEEGVDIDMLASSDTGMSDRDRVTRINRPTFSGVAEVGAVVYLFANGELVGSGVVGSDETDFVPDDGLGVWEVSVNPLDDGRYEVLAHIEDAAGNFLRTDSITVEIDTTQPNTPYLDLLNDNGHADYDNITGFDQLTFNMTTEDPDIPGGREDEFNYKYRIFLRPEGGEETLVYNSVVATDIPAENLLSGFTNLQQLTTTLAALPDGIHNFKLEVEDRAGNISEDFLLNVQIDTEVTGAPTIDMIASSDSGMSDQDNVTGIDQPAFTGVSEVGSTVRLRANGVLIGEAEVHSDDSDGVPGDGLGEWEITSEPLDDGIHLIDAEVEDWAGNIASTSSLTIEVDTIAPNTPYLDLVSASDTGIGGGDEVTADTTPTFTMTTTDASPDPHLIEQNLKFRLYVRPEGGAETLLYDSAVDGTIPAGNIQDGLTDLGFLERTMSELPEGTHNFKLEVEDRAGNISEDFLLNVTIDTTLEAPTLDLVSSSDSGMSDLDNVTRISQPAFAGIGDVGDRVSLFANGILVGTGFVGSDLTDFNPGDGKGAWEITSNPLDDGVYEVLAHIEDAAGNFQRTEPLQIEIDTFEPNMPQLDLVTSSDLGHSNHDNITADATPTFSFTTEDPGQADHLSPFNYKYRLYLRPEGGSEVLIYNSVTDPDIPANALDGGFTSLEYLEATIGPLPDGLHNVKLEVEDRAGNISHDVVLDFEIDTAPPLEGDLDMLDASDSGVSFEDNVTNKDQPAFDGLGTPGTQVRLFANGEFVGTTEVGSDESDGEIGNGLGVWEITSEPLDDGVYSVNATFEDWAGNFSTTDPLIIEVDTLAPNTPFLDLMEAVDSGRHNDDNITNAEVLAFSATTHDPNVENHEVLFPGGENLKYRLFVRPESGLEFLAYDSSTDPLLAPSAVDGLISLHQILTNVPDLPEGLHGFKLEVEDRAGNISEDFLMNVLIDRTATKGTAGLLGDTGIWGIESTFGDGITGGESATISGTAEANNIVTLLVNGELVGSDVALPFDGDDAYPNGFWQIDATFADGTNQITVVFEDPAGNQIECDLDDSLVIDTSGPRILNVTQNETGVSVFDPKPAGGPDDLVTSVVVTFIDGPARPEGIPYSAVLEQLATEEGNYRLVGDASGDIPITNVSVISDFTGPGTATTQVRLDFGVTLPDDRYTFTVFDRIADAAGNPLDGESGANGPFVGSPGLMGTLPIFPTGDGNHGGDFVARFTIDSRPELGVWSAGSIYTDTNGNFVWDTTNADYVNRDITYSVGFTSDDIFAGNFAGPNGVTDGYDKLAAYGRYGGWEDGTYRWLVDLNNDGVVDIDVEDPADVNGLPVAGNFDPATAGDQVALYTGETWHFDTNGDYRVDLRLESELTGYPVVGDFDRDGFDDLAAWADDVFMIDLANGIQNGWDGEADASFRFGFIGVRERPVSADMDQDGFDDLGLWVPDRGGATGREAGEWYWLVSGGNSLLDRIVESRDPVRGGSAEILFRPIPFGEDIFAQFGDEFAIPVVGNFDPPSLPGLETPTNRFHNPINSLDVDDDGVVTPRDALIVINQLNAQGPSSIDALDEAMYVDTTDDGWVTARDVLEVINYLNRPAGEPEVLDEISRDIALALAGHDEGDDA